MIRLIICFLLLSAFAKSQTPEAQWRVRDNANWDTIYVRNDTAFRKVVGEYVFLKRIDYTRIVQANGSVDWSNVLNAPAFITGINSGNVTTALGYTPVNPTAISNINNTSDAAKPVSDATVTALGLKANIASPTFTGTVAGITATMVGLGNVTNTSDANKPVSAAQQTAINLKENTIAAGTTSQYYRGDKTWQTYQGYTINVQALTSSPADGATTYFGALPKAPVSAAATSKIYIRKAGTLRVAEIYCYSGTAGTNENWSISIRVNNTTDHLIATVGTAVSERVFSKTDLAISLNVGDYIEIKMVNPTWVTNPLTCVIGGYIYIE